MSSSIHKQRNVKRVDKPVVKGVTPQQVEEKKLAYFASRRYIIKNLPNLTKIPETDGKATQKYQESAKLSSIKTPLTNKQKFDATLQKLEKSIDNFFRSATSGENTLTPQALLVIVLFIPLLPFILMLWIYNKLNSSDKISSLEGKGNGFLASFIDDTWNKYCLENEALDKKVTIMKEIIQKSTCFTNQVKINLLEQYDKLEKTFMAHSVTMFDDKVLAFSEQIKQNQPLNLKEVNEFIENVRLAGKLELLYFTDSKEMFLKALSTSSHDALNCYEEHKFKVLEPLAEKVRAAVGKDHPIHKKLYVFMEKVNEKVREFTEEHESINSKIANHNNSEQELTEQVKTFFDNVRAQILKDMEFINSLNLTASQILPPAAAENILEVIDLSKYRQHVERITKEIEEIVAQQREGFKYYEDYTNDKGTFAQSEQDLKDMEIFSEVINNQLKTFEKRIKDKNEDSHIQDNVSEEIESTINSDNRQYFELKERFVSTKQKDSKGILDKKYNRYIGRYLNWQNKFEQFTARIAKYKLGEEFTDIVDSLKKQVEKDKGDFNEALDLLLKSTAIGTKELTDFLKEIDEVTEQTNTKILQIDKLINDGIIDKLIDQILKAVDEYKEHISLLNKRIDILKEKIEKEEGLEKEKEELENLRQDVKENLQTFVKQCKKLISDLNIDSITEVENFISDILGQKIQDEDKLQEIEKAIDKKIQANRLEKMNGALAQYEKHMHAVFVKFNELKHEIEEIAYLSESEAEQARAIILSQQNVLMLELEDFREEVAKSAKSEINIDQLNAFLNNVESAKLKNDKKYKDSELKIKDIIKKITVVPVNHYNAHVKGLEKPLLSIISKLKKLAEKEKHIYALNMFEIKLKGHLNNFEEECESINNDINSITSRVSGTKVLDFKVKEQIKLDIEELEQLMKSAEINLDKELANYKLNVDGYNDHANRLIKLIEEKQEEIKAEGYLDLEKLDLTSLSEALEAKKKEIALKLEKLKEEATEYKDAKELQEQINIQIDSDNKTYANILERIEDKRIKHLQTLLDEELKKYRKFMEEAVSEVNKFHESHIATLNSMLYIKLDLSPDIKNNLITKLEKKFGELIPKLNMNYPTLLKNCNNLKAIKSLKQKDVAEFANSIKEAIQDDSENIRIYHQAVEQICMYYKYYIESNAILINHSKHCFDFDDIIKALPAYSRESDRILEIAGVMNQNRSMLFRMRELVENDDYQGEWQLILEKLYKAAKQFREIDNNLLREFILELYHSSSQNISRKFDECESEISIEGFSIEFKEDKIDLENLKEYKLELEASLVSTIEAQKRNPESEELIHKFLTNLLPYSETVAHQIDEISENIKQKWPGIAQKALYEYRQHLQIPILKVMEEAIEAQDEKAQEELKSLQRDIDEARLLKTQSSKVHDRNSMEGFNVEIAKQQKIDEERLDKIIINIKNAKIAKQQSEEIKRKAQELKNKLHRQIEEYRAEIRLEFEGINNKIAALIKQADRETIGQEAEKLLSKIEGDLNQLNKEIDEQDFINEPEVNENKYLSKFESQKKQDRQDINKLIDRIKDSEIEAQEEIAEAARIKFNKIKLLVADYKEHKNNILLELDKLLLEYTIFGDLSLPKDMYTKLASRMLENINKLNSILEDPSKIAEQDEQSLTENIVNWKKEDIKDTEEIKAVLKAIKNKYFQDRAKEQIERYNTHTVSLEKQFDKLWEDIGNENKTSEAAKNLEDLSLMLEKYIKYFTNYKIDEKINDQDSLHKLTKEVDIAIKTDLEAIEVISKLIFTMLYEEAEMFRSSQHHNLLEGISLVRTKISNKLKDGQLRQELLHELTNLENEVKLDRNFHNEKIKINSRDNLENFKNNVDNVFSKDRERLKAIENKITDSYLKDKLDEILAEYTKHLDQEVPDYIFLVSVGFLPGKDVTMIDEQFNELQEEFRKNLTAFITESEKIKEDQLDKFAKKIKDQKITDIDRIKTLVSNLKDMQLRKVFDAYRAHYTSMKKFIKNSKEELLEFHINDKTCESDMVNFNASIETHFKEFEYQLENHDEKVDVDRYQYDINIVIKDEQAQKQVLEFLIESLFKQWAIQKLNYYQGHLQKDIRLLRQEIISHGEEQKNSLLSELDTLTGRIESALAVKGLVDKTKDKNSAQELNRKIDDTIIADKLELEKIKAKLLSLRFATILKEWKQHETIVVEFIRFNSNVKIIGIEDILQEFKSQLEEFKLLFEDQQHNVTTDSEYINKDLSNDKLGNFEQKIKEFIETNNSKMESLKELLLETYKKAAKTAVESYKTHLQVPIKEAIDDITKTLGGDHPIIVEIKALRETIENPTVLIEHSNNVKDENTFKNFRVEIEVQKEEDRKKLVELLSRAEGYKILEAGAGYEDDQAKVRALNKARSYTVKLREKIKSIREKLENSENPEDLLKKIKKKSDEIEEKGDEFETKAKTIVPEEEESFNEKVSEQEENDNSDLDELEKEVNELLKKENEEKIKQLVEKRKAFVIKLKARAKNIKEKVGRNTNIPSFKELEGFDKKLDKYLNDLENFKPDPVKDSKEIDQEFEEQNNNDEKEITRIESEVDKDLINAIQNKITELKNKYLNNANSTAEEIRQIRVKIQENSKKDPAAKEHGIVADEVAKTELEIMKPRNAAIDAKYQTIFNKSDLSEKDKDEFEALVENFMNLNNFGLTSTKRAYLISLINTIFSRYQKHTVIMNEESTLLEQRAEEVGLDIKAQILTFKKSLTEHLDNFSRFSKNSEENTIKAFGLEVDSQIEKDKVELNRLKSLIQESENKNAEAKIKAQQEKEQLQLQKELLSRLDLVIEDYEAHADKLIDKIDRLNSVFREDDNVEEQMAALIYLRIKIIKDKNEIKAKRALFTESKGITEEQFRDINSDIKLAKRFDIERLNTQMRVIELIERKLARDYAKKYETHSELMKNQVDAIISEISSLRKRGELFIDKVLNNKKAFDDESSKIETFQIKSNNMVMREFFGDSENYINDELSEEDYEELLFKLQEINTDFDKKIVNQIERDKKDLDALSEIKKPIKINVNEDEIPAESSDEDDDINLLSDIEDNVKEIMVEKPVRLDQKELLNTANRAFHKYKDHYEGMAPMINRMISIYKKTPVVKQQVMELIKEVTKNEKEVKTRFGNIVENEEQYIDIKKEVKSFVEFVDDAIEYEELLLKGIIQIFSANGSAVMRNRETAIINNEIWDLNKNRKSEKEKPKSNQHEEENEIDLEYSDFGDDGIDFEFEQELQNELSHSQKPKPKSNNDDEEQLLDGIEGEGNGPKNKKKEETENVNVNPNKNKEEEVEEEDDVDEEVSTIDYEKLLEVIKKIGKFVDKIKTILDNANLSTEQVSQLYKILESLFKVPPQPVDKLYYIVRSRNFDDYSQAIIDKAMSTIKEQGEKANFTENDFFDICDNYYYKATKNLSEKVKENREVTRNNLHKLSEEFHNLPIKLEETVSIDHTAIFNFSESVNKYSTGGANINKKLTEQVKYFYKLLGKEFGSEITWEEVQKVLTQYIGNQTAINHGGQMRLINVALVATMIILGHDIRLSSDRKVLEMSALWKKLIEYSNIQHFVVGSKIKAISNMSDVFKNVAKEEGVKTYENYKQYLIDILKNPNPEVADISIEGRHKSLLQQIKDVSKKVSGFGDLYKYASSLADLRQRIITRKRTNSKRETIPLNPDDEIKIFVNRIFAEAQTYNVIDYETGAKVPMLEKIVNSIDEKEKRFFEPFLVAKTVKNKGKQESIDSEKTGNKVKGKVLQQNQKGIKPESKNQKKQPKLAENAITDKQVKVYKKEDVINLFTKLFEYIDQESLEILSTDIKKTAAEISLLKQNLFEYEKKPMTADELQVRINELKAQKKTADDDKIKKKILEQLRIFNMQVDKLGKKPKLRISRFCPDIGGKIDIHGELKARLTYVENLKQQLAEAQAKKANHEADAAEKKGEIKGKVLKKPEINGKNSKKTEVKGKKFSIGKNPVPSKTLKV